MWCMGANRRKTNKWATCNFWVGIFVDYKRWMHLFPGLVRVADVLSREEGDCACWDLLWSCSM